MYGIFVYRGAALAAWGIAKKMADTAIPLLWRGARKGGVVKHLFYNFPVPASVGADSVNHVFAFKFQHNTIQRSPWDTSFFT